MSATYTLRAPTIFSTRNSSRPLRIGASLVSTVMFVQTSTLCEQGTGLRHGSQATSGNHQPARVTGLKPRPELQERQAVDCEARGEAEQVARGGAQPLH